MLLPQPRILSPLRLPFRHPGIVRDRPPPSEHTASPQPVSSLAPAPAAGEAASLSRLRKRSRLRLSFDEERIRELQPAGFAGAGGSKCSWNPATTFPATDTRNPPAASSACHSAFRISC